MSQSYCHCGAMKCLPAETVKLGTQTQLLARFLLREASDREMFEMLVVEVQVPHHWYLHQCRFYLVIYHFIILLFIFILKFCDVR